MTDIAFEPSSAVSVTLSNSNWTATCTTATATPSFPTDENCGAKGAVAEAKSTGKFYFEVVFNLIDPAGHSSNHAIGIATYDTVYSTVADYSNFIPPFSSNAVVVSYLSGIYNAVYYNSDFSDFRIPTRVVSTPANGDVIGIAVDLDNNLVWMKNVTQAGLWNIDPSTMTSSADPATGVDGLPFNSGLSYVPFTSCDLNALQSTIILLEGSFTGAIPAGFSAWDAGSGGGGQTGVLASVEGPDIASFEGDNFYPVVFDPDTASDVVLSNGTLTGTSSSLLTSSGAKGTPGAVRVTGKRYFEVTFNSVSPDGTHQMVGVGSPDYTDYSTITSQQLALFASSDGFIRGHDPSGPRTYYPFGTPNIPDGMVVAFAVDFDLGKMWLRQCTEGVNGGTWNGVSGNPQFNVNGISIAPNTALVPYMIFGGGSAWSPAPEMTFNFKGPFSFFDIPSGTTGGFIPWNDPQSQLGVLAATEGQDHVHIVGTAVGFTSGTRRVFIVT